MNSVSHNLLGIAYATPVGEEALPLSKPHRNGRFAPFGNPQPRTPWNRCERRYFCEFGLSWSAILVVLNLQVKHLYSHAKLTFMNINFGFYFETLQGPLRAQIVDFLRYGESLLMYSRSIKLTVVYMTHLRRKLSKIFPNRQGFCRIVGCLGDR